MHNTHVIYTFPFKTVFDLESSGFSSGIRVNVFKHEFHVMGI